MQMIKDPILQTASSSSAPVKSDSVTTSKNSESKKNNKKGGDKASAGSSNSIVPWIDDKFMMKDTPAEKPSWDMDSD
ncbi:hypothetical protein HK100_012644 [Physocladia obscura]|uniref:Uncharacterized protein n=1 Tax=Physocladia obscura TaxID=109957 RepID=A0AAD5T225_9FUNG|nr:hypothetical protein HK100_012644 [Physocladia obscura]